MIPSAIKHPAHHLNVVVVVVVLTLTHCYNAVRGHRTGSNNSRAEDHLTSRRKTNKKQKIIHTITETNHILVPPTNSTEY